MAWWHMCVQSVCLRLSQYMGLSHYCLGSWLSISLPYGSLPFLSLYFSHSFSPQCPAMSLCLKRCQPKIPMNKTTDRHLLLSLSLSLCLSLSLSHTHTLIFSFQEGHVSTCVHDERAHNPFTHLETQENDKQMKILQVFAVTRKVEK